MDMTFKPGASSLYCIDKNLSIEKKLSNLTISNGMAWTSDNKRMYFIDSPTQSVQSYSLIQLAGISCLRKTLFLFQKKWVHLMECVSTGKVCYG
jgi:sugar lactone lactonase YvrE